MPRDLLADEPRDLLAEDNKLTGNPAIDMAGVNKDLANAQKEVTPLRTIDRGVSIVLDPVTQQLLGAAKTISGGGSSILEKYGILPKSRPTDAFNKLGQMIGYIPVVKAATTIAAAIPGLAGNNLASLMAQQAVAGAGAGTYGTPDNRKSGALVGGALGVLLPPAAIMANKGVNFLKNIPGAMNQIKRNFKNIQDPALFGQQTREALFNAKRTVGQTFGNELDDLIKAKPNESVDLSNDFGRINAAMNDVENNPGLSTQIKSIFNRVRNPNDAAMLKKFIDNPSSASSVSLADSQKLKVAIQNAPDIATKLAKGKFADYNPADLEILDLLDNVKLRQAEIFPELTQIRKPYSDFMKNYDIVKNDFKPRNLLQKVRSGFGNEEIQKIINTIIPDKTVKDIVGFRNAEKVVKAAKLTGEAAAGVTASAIVGKKVWDLTH